MMNKAKQPTDAHTLSKAKKMFWRKSVPSQTGAVSGVQIEKPKKTKIKPDLAGVIDKVKTHKTLRTYLVVIAVLFLMYWIVSPVVTVVQLRYQVTTMKDTISELEMENKILNEEINKVNTPSYIEEIARDELGMVKGAESPVMIYETETDTHKEKTKLKSNEKIGIYMKDWYVEMSEWFEKGKK